MIQTTLEYEGLKILAPAPEHFQKILSPPALKFLSTLSRTFTPRLKQLLSLREKRQEALDHGELPNFLPETTDIRKSKWQVASIPPDLQNRIVEITGPADPKMVINALNAPVKVFMADFEDSKSPTWSGLVLGQLALYDAVRGTLTYDNEQGKSYHLNKKTAVLMARMRGCHLIEKHITVDDEYIPGCLVDFGLYFFHNAKALMDKGTGPYFYVPKLESHLEARWWNDVFQFSENFLGLPIGSIKATVLIETLLAAFEMEEILYEMRDHIVGLNCGRWDYIFSFIKKLRCHPDKLLPDRRDVTMDKGFLNAYSKLLIQTCHKRGAFAMGGMAAFIPIKNDAQANQIAFEKVRQDKEREAQNGHDGTWIAHPGLAPLAEEIFEKHLKGPNQLSVMPEDRITARDLLTVPHGKITEQGLRNNIKVGIQYLDAWISGNGCVPLYNLMEDAATAEIARAQIWQWIRHPKGFLEDGRKVTIELFRQCVQEEILSIQKEIGDNRFKQGRFKEAIEIMDKITTDPNFVEFLTLVAYDYID
ncbi:MAG: malate synthase A [Gammaproteobacteria bacterium]|nr:malate synthase A [Gammaproteobacteria bacterium]